jgi:hypothetical protein
MVEVGVQRGAHRGRPGGPKVHGDLVNRLVVRVVGHVGCDLVEHPHQACGVTRRCTDPVRAADVCPAVIGAADL